MKVVQLTQEMARIIALPRRTPVDCSGELSALLRRPGGTQMLRPVQAQALYELWKVGGLFAPIKVGGGKTLVSFLAAMILGALRPLLLLPAKLISKTRAEMIEASKHWRIPNYIRMHSYELLGRLQAVETLNRYQPDLLIFDEAHKLRNKDVSVTRRVRRYLKTHPAGVVVLSGTITKHSIRDYEHLLLWALGPLNTPLPTKWSEIESWADALDEHTHERADPGALSLLTENHSTDLSTVRKAYQKRLTETLGVVSTPDTPVAASLVIQGKIVRQGSAIRDAFEKLRNHCELPDGWGLTQAVDVWRHARELALGFYYRWDPKPPDEWIEPRRDWARACRKILSSSRDLDSELAVIEALNQGLNQPLARLALKAWAAVKPTFEPNVVPVWIDDGPLEWAQEWAGKEPGIVWCGHVAFSKELARRSGYTYYGRKGLSAEGKSIESHPTDWSCIASIKGNIEGRNLQAWSRGLIVSPMSSGDEFQQLLARFHRPGQLEDEVSFDIGLGCIEHVNGIYKALGQAKYAIDTLGDDQKLLIANLVDIQAPLFGGPQWEEKEDA